MKNGVVEKHYTVAETALLIQVSTKTVRMKLRAGEFGPDVVDLAIRPGESEPSTHDYRIPASAVNAFLVARRVFTEPGISARSTGELRRKAAPV